MRNWRSSAAIVALLSAQNACSPTPAREPAPRPVPAAPTPAAQPAEETLPLESTFSYGSGAFRYEVLTESAITQSGDSTPTEATVRTTLFVTVQTASLAGDSLSVSVTLDSAFAERDSLIPAPERLPSAADSVILALDSVAAPATPSLTTTIGAQGIPLDGFPSSGSECVPEDRGELLAIARDLLVEVPHTLRVGTTWADTTTVAICRGGVPVTSGVVRSYEVLDPRRAEDGTPLTRLARTTAFSLAGTRTTEYGQVIALSGSGESRSVIELDAALGIVRSVGLDGTSDVTVTYGRTTTPFRQRVVQSARLIPEPGTRH